MRKEGEIVTVHKILEKNGISFFHIHSEKFKTVRLDVFFIEPLEKERVSSNALIPYLLKRGCRRYPTQQELALRLEELYGAGIDVAVYKKGENQILHINAGFVADQYTADRTTLFDEMGSLMMEVITEPSLEDGLFPLDYFRQEQGNMIQRIRSRVNDKMYYALYRCMEEMCKGEPFAIYEDGEEDDVKKLTKESVMKDYRSLLQKSPICVYISGNVTDEEIHQFIQKFDVMDRTEIHKPIFASVKKDVGEIKRVEEPMDVSQGKLCLGFRTQTGADSPDYYSLAIYNGILGGGVQSKLFQNVREKESLAYSAFSRLEKFKGLLVICGGIEISQREKAEQIIMKQLKAIEKGDISDLEMEATKKSFETGLKSMQDSQGSLVDFFLSQYLSGVNENIDIFMNRLMKVGKQDVVNISRKITPDTVYFLTSLSGETPERSE